MINEKQYYYLKKGEIVQDGDEVEMSAKYNDDAKWQKASVHSIGTPAPDPQFMAHRVYRREMSVHLQNKADRAKDEKIVAAIMKTDVKGLSRREAATKLKNAIDDATS